MSKKVLFIVAAVVLIGLGIGGYFYWKNSRLWDKKSQQPGDILTDKATQGVLPSFGEQSNPLEKMPEINPVENANPYRSVKTNPFE